MKHKIRLDTLSDINRFVSICSQFTHKIDLIDGDSYRVSAKSLIGAVATMDWSEVYVECEHDIYSHIADFVV
jgi:hypothetical protein